MTPILAQRARSDRAFERLYQRHVGDVYRYALVVLRNEADAEDVTQTTFLNAYRAFKGGERPRTPQNWLIAIAHNVCRQRFRQAARRPNEVAFDEDVSESLAPDDDSPTAHDIRRALDHLAFNQRAALVMRELEGRSYTEISEILGLSVSAVETLIFRARRALREQLEGGLTCHEAELAVSKQLDGRLSREDKGALRAHLRECDDCARFARSQRAQRTAIRSLAAVPIPSSLGSFFGGGGAVAAGSSLFGVGAVVKAVTVCAAVAMAGGVGYEGVKHAPWRSPARHHRVAAPAPSAANRVVHLPSHSPEGRGTPVPGRGPDTEPRGVLPKPGHVPHVAVEPHLALSDVTPGLALGHDKYRATRPIRPVRSVPVVRKHAAPPARAHTNKPLPPQAHGGKAHGPKSNPAHPGPPQPLPPTTGHGGGKK